MGRIKLIDVDKDGKVTISDEAKIIYPFSAMLTVAYNKQPGDGEGKKRKRALMEFKYIYFRYDWASLHHNLEEEKIHEEAMNSAGMPKKYRFSNELKMACDKFERLRYTRPVKQLRTARVSMDRVRNFLDSVDPGEMEELKDDNNNVIGTKPKYDTKTALEISKMVKEHVKDLPDVLKKLSDLEAQVMKEESEETTARGEHTLGRLQ